MAKTFSHLQPKPVQFRLWGLLVVMTAVAIAAAVGAPYLRGYEAGELILRIGCGLWSVVCFGIGIVLGWRRPWRLPADSGAVVFALAGCRYHPRKQSSWFARWFFPLAFVLSAFVAGFKLFGDFTFFQQPLFTFLYAIVIWVFYGFLLGMSARSRSNYLIAVCDAGVSLGRPFLYWDEVVLASWQADCENVLALLVKSDLGHVYLQVPAEDRIATEEFVRAKTKFKD
jgi:hypothetical protein